MIREAHVNTRTLISAPILLLFLLSTVARAEQPGPTAGGAFSLAVRPNHNFILDFGLTMPSTSESVLGVHHAVSSLEEKLIGRKWFEEKSFLGKTGGILLRLAKLYLFDLPQDYFPVVFAHEFSGHGARYREFGIDDVDYGYDWPPPYGPGGGQASATLSGVQVSVHEHLAIWLGGLESQAVMNRMLTLDWMERGAIRYREASLFCWSTQIAWNYVMGSEESLQEGHHPNDLEAYVRLLNQSYGHLEPDQYPMNIRRLKSKWWLNAANPFFFVTLWDLVKTYLWDGGEMTTLPMIPVFGAGYLPALRTGLTPFGVEYHFENYLKNGSRVYMLDIRVGDNSYVKSWAGAGLLVRNLHHTRAISLDLSLDLWKQPAIQLEGKPGIPPGSQLGGAASVRGYYNFRTPSFPLHAVLALGFKSAGFLEGHRLGSGLIFQFGLGIGD
ncbi:MAG: hypothetical protein FJY80_00320 [Candidatus Aminicenantes bacterium]|nr:hypothetical protein [Candidatus Aminicenantes bacterium]